MTVASRTTNRTEPAASAFGARDDWPASWRALSSAALLDAVRTAHATGHGLRATRGRDTRAALVDGHRLAVKRFVGDEPREWWYERLRGAPRDPAEREARALARAGTLGLRVPRPLLALREDPAPRLAPPRPGRGASAWLVTAWLDHDDHLGRRAARERDPARRRALLGATAELVARLHAAGGYHRDLYLLHLVLCASDPGGVELALLDLGRCRFEPDPRERWFVKDLAALDGSAGDAVTARERLRFLALWRRATGRGPADARRVATAARLKARALFAHAPIDPGTDRVGWPREDADDARIDPAEEGAR